ncbi:MAG: hypothetical protein OJF49_004577 [Ktedonobacterales bacterium]|nr:MAG: hypothetical protein OJF49_004577 [Ktedonobacterales bacterium]
MPYTLRTMTEADDARRAALLNIGEPEPITVETIRDWRRSESPERIVLRLGAVNDMAGIAAYGHALRDSWNATGVFWLYIVVDPAERRQHAATQLFDALSAFARDHGATRYYAEVRDNVLEGLLFAEHCGFRVERHIFESTLDLATFDETRFAGAIEATEASGIRFFTLADLDDTEEAQRKLCEINERLGRDVPGSDSSPRPFEAFQKQVCQAAWYRPDGQIIAADGDRWIGMTAVGYFESPQPMMWTMFTGVEREYRGRGIALALKLLAVRCARRYGAAHMRTNNDSENAPMLAVNGKLGYQPQPGFYKVVRNLG